MTEENSKEERGVLNTERDRGPASWPYLGTRAPQLAEPVGRTLRSGVFHIAVCVCARRVCVYLALPARAGGCVCVSGRVLCLWGAALTV